MVQFGQPNGVPGRQFPPVQFIIGIGLLGYAEIVCDLSLFVVVLVP